MTRSVTLTAITFIGLFGLTIGCSADRDGVGDVVVEASKVSSAGSNKRATNELILLDARSHDDYLAGHVAGAVHVDVEQWTSWSLSPDTDLRHPAFWSERIGALGIDGRRPVAIYDSGNMTSAARIWFILQHFGVGNVSVIDGGFPAMMAIDETGRPAMEAKAAVLAKRSLDATLDKGAPVGFIDSDGIREKLDSGDMQILDVRTLGEYKGTTKLKNPRGGHLPGAINLSHKELLTNDGKLLPPDEVTKRLLDAGIVRGKPIVIHCQSGGRASLAALAAVRSGFLPVFNYYESFGDWSADESCPVVTD